MVDADAGGVVVVVAGRMVVGVVVVRVVVGVVRVVVRVVVVDTHGPHEAQPQSSIT